MKGFARRTLAHANRANLWDSTNNRQYSGGNDALHTGSDLSISRRRSRN